MTPAISRRRTNPWDDSQPDLFIALPSDIPARDQQDLMERPFFSLAKNKRTAPIEYKQNLQSSRQNSRPSKQIDRSFLSLGSNSFRLKLCRCCFYP